MVPVLLALSHSPDGDDAVWRLCSVLCLGFSSKDG
jgi:hypothetical protein